MFSLHYFGGLAFPRQTGPLFLEDVVVQGLDAVYCEGESLCKEPKVDDRHLTEFKHIEIEKRDLSLTQLCDFQERLLKDVAGTLHADQIGGNNVTRLDRMLRQEHPRLTYREALAALNRRGFTVAFGDDLDQKAEASLIRYCGDLPVHVTHYPESLKFFNMKLDRRGLPFPVRGSPHRAGRIRPGRGPLAAIRPRTGEHQGRGTLSPGSQAIRGFEPDNPGHDRLTVTGGASRPRPYQLQSRDR